MTEKPKTRLKYNWTEIAYTLIISALAIAFATIIFYHI